jgi:argininosuccinate synthase
MGSVCFHSNVGRSTALPPWTSIDSTETLTSHTHTQANAQYEGRYLLGTSLARPVIAKKQVRGAARAESKA